MRPVLPFVSGPAEMVVHQPFSFDCLPRVIRNRKTSKLYAVISDVQFQPLPFEQEDAGDAPYRAGA